jgi:hypothetical protein
MSQFFILLFVTQHSVEYRSAECHSAECCCAKCHFAKYHSDVCLSAVSILLKGIRVCISLLTVSILSIIQFNDILLSVTQLSFVVINAVLINDIPLSVILLSGVLGTLKVTIVFESVSKF